MSVIDKLGGGHDEPPGCKRIVGQLLMFIGILVMLATGICTVYVMIDDPSEFVLYLLIGGVPFAIAFGVYWLGNWMNKPPKSEDTDHLSDEPPLS